MSVEKNFARKLGGPGELSTYEGGKSYTRLAPKDRKIGINKPDDPRAVRFHGKWFLPICTLPDSKRRMPETRSDEEAYEHMAVNILCMCHVCCRPAAEKWRRKWRREQGLSG